MKALLISRFYFVVVEAIVLFLIVLVGMFYYSWQGIFLVNRSIDSRAVFHILQTSFFVSLGFTFTYRVSKAVLFLVLRQQLRKLPQYFGKTTKLSEIAIDIYLLLAFVLVIVPVRPILQETIVTSSDFLIGERFAKYDAFPTALLLLQVGTVCSLILLFSQKEKKKASFYILMFVLIAAGAIAVNMRPNYNARISEARAAWTAHNYTLLMQKAHEALAVSENNSDKATAYYWMGVAANRMDNPKLAIEYQKKSIKSDPTLGYPYSSIAFAQIALKDYANASQSASLCIQNDKYYAWCYLAMFEYYFYSEVNMKKADEYLSLAERIEPENREIRETRKFFNKDKAGIEKLQKQGIRVITDEK